MKRRNFIKTTALATVPLALNGIPVMASSKFDSSALELLAQSSLNCGKILVIIQMNGGNDGLNTVFPLDEWSNLSNARANILMNQSDVLTLNNNITTGLHPAMSELKNLYDTGKLMIVQGVSYPNPSYSHFRATDIWFTAANSNQSLNTGWLGRSLEVIYPGNNYPNASMTDPLAIQIGSTLPFSLQGTTSNLGYNTPNPASLLNVINQITDPVPNSDYGTELAFLRLMKDQSNAYRTVIQTAYNTPQASSATYPTSNSLGDQLRIVAKLINGGLKTPIYVVNHPNSHDTHANQVDITDKRTGSQANNLSILSKAIGAFQQDLELMGKSNLVTGMTFSEFGRRIKSNSSLGTDHGDVAPIIFFGAALNTSPTAVAGTSEPVPGMIGTSPTLPASAGVNDFAPRQFDFRQIYSSIMQDWLCMTEAEANQVLGGSYTKLPIFQSTALSSTNFDLEDNDFVAVYPNPIINSKVNIIFRDPINSSVNIQIFSIQGSLIYSGNSMVENDSLQLLVNNLTTTGMYILQIIYNEHKFYKKIIVP